VLPIAGGIVLSGTGPTNGTFYQLSATNVTLPLNLWAPISTNVFDGAGHFTVTNQIAIGEPQRFYRLQLP
jgi:hypothetical protein